MIKWNNKDGNGMILNVHGIALAIPVSLVLWVCLGMRNVLEYMALLKIQASLTSFMQSYWQFIRGYV
jgi:hypothetical protein